MAGTLERHRMEEQNESSGSPAYIIIHRVCCMRPSERHIHHRGEALFLDPPRMFKGDRKDSSLRGKQGLTDLKGFLYKRPEIIFVVQRDYSCEDYLDSTTDASAFERIVDAKVYSQMPDHIRPFLFLLTEDTAPANPTSEKIHHCSKSFVDAMSRIQNLNVPGVDLLDGWNSNNSLVAPYLQFYHTKALLENSSKEIRRLDGQQIDLLLRYLELNFGQLYREVDALFQSGSCTKEHFDKLFWRGQIVTKEERGQITAFIIRFCSSTDADTITLGCETWTFHGKFQRESKTLNVSRPTGPGKVPISSLGVVPLQFDNTGLKERLIKRGRFFWNCRNGGLVTSVAPRQGFEIKLTNPRYMIDMATYNEIHGEDETAEARTKEGFRRDDIGAEAMSKDDPPAGPFVLMMPPTIPAFRFHDKKWQTVSVEHLRPVEWDHDAFRRLVLNAGKKDLIQSLVQNHLADAGNSSADLIEGKGNGLVILLHGGPGTGKTLTAESVAELAGRPLYRLTCGDIGTVPETVEKSLEWIFYLGSLWQSVVLLDESEVFLEERSQTDLQRNALVSVFLRAMEYYDGILILTSNRVGVFDEAFKSRVHLSIYYPPLKEGDRRKIWGNFFSVIEEELRKDKSLKIDLKDLRSSAQTLAEHVLNGREIRNAIRTARHLASFRNQTFSTIHLEQTIEIAKEFDEYIKNTKGQTDAELAEAMRVRWDNESGT